VDGKDIEERTELALKWDALAASWTVIGDAEEHRLSEIRAAILRVMADIDEPVGPTDVADALDEPVNKIKQRMYQMSKDGELKVVARGRYVLGTHNLHNLHNFREEKVTEVMKVTEGDNLSKADTDNARFQQLLDEGWSEEMAMKEMMGEGID
jgi:hypothetical protein